MPLVIILFALFASIFGLSKATLEYSEPFFLVGSRMAFAGVLLVIHQLVVHKKSLQLNKTLIKNLFLLGFFNIYLTNILEIWGLKHIASSKACLIYSLSPFLSALFSFFIFSEILSKRKWMGLFIGLLGLCPLILQDIQSHAGGGFFVPHPGDIAMIVAVVCNVYGWIVLKRVVSETDVSPLFANGVSMIIGGVLGLGHSYLAGESWKPVPIFDMEIFLRNSFLMCIISNIICYNLYGYLLQRYSATFMAFAGLVTPLFASFFGWLFLDELITWQFVFSFLLFSVGLYVFHQEELKKVPAMA